jgi:hypothetical protein
VIAATRGYPKCLYGYAVRPVPAERRWVYGPRVQVAMPRVTMSVASDVRAWWPACTEYQPREG